MLRRKKSNLSGIRVQLYILGLIRFTEAVAWTSIFPYAYFMIRSFHSISENNIALFAGLLVSIFTFAEFLSAVPWAWVADRIGRRNTLLIGLVGSIASATMFGLSRNIVLATVARAIGGLMNPNVGVVQTCIAELATRRDQQAKAFSIVPYLRGLGNLVGPVIGGFLAEPSKNYASTFSGSEFWLKYPYFFPNLVVVVLLSLTLVISFFFLEETQPSRTASGSFALRLGNRRIRGPNPPDRSKPESDAHAVTNTNNASEAKGGESKSTDIQVSNAANESVDAPNRYKEGKVFTTQVKLQILSVSLLAFHKVAWDVIIPVFLASPSSSAPEIHISSGAFRFNTGFGLKTRTIGPLLLAQACVAIAAQYLLVPRIVSAYGPLRVYRCCLWLFTLAYVVTPFTVRLHKPGSVVAITFDMIVKVLLSSTGYTCSAILVTNTVSSRAYLARINGAGAAAGCLARSIGPLVAGRLFDWSLQARLIVIPFWILAGVALCGALESVFLTDQP